MTISIDLYDFTVRTSYDEHCNGTEAGMYDGTEATTVEAIWDHVQDQPERFGEHENISFVVPASELTWEFPVYVAEHDFIEIRVSEDMETVWRVEGTTDDWTETGDDRQTIEDINNIFESYHRTTCPKFINLIPRKITHEGTTYPASDGIDLSYLMQYDLGKDITPKNAPPEVENGVYYIVSPVAYMLHGKPKNFVLPMWENHMVSDEVTGFCPPLR